MKKKVEKEIKKKKKISKAEKHVDKFLNIELPELNKSAELLDYKMMEVKMSSIKTKVQVRKEFSEEGIKELAESMEVEGLISPIEVRKDGDGLTIIAGERRYRAAKRLGWVKIPAIIRRKIKEEEVVYRQLIENLQRVDLSAMEESIALNDIKVKFNLSNRDIGKRVGKSETRISRSLKYIDLLEKLAYTQVSSMGVMILDELLSIKNEEYFSGVVKSIEVGDITTTNIREKIVLEKRKYLKDFQKKEKIEKDIDNILTKIEEVFYKHIDSKLIKLRADFRTDLTDEQVVKVTTRLKKLVQELENFSQFLTKENLGKISTTVNLSGTKNVKEKKVATKYPSTRLKDISYRSIDSNLARNKTDVINFILEKIDIQKEVLERTPLRLIIDHWNALPYQGEINNVQNFYFKAISKPFILPREFTIIKKDVGDKFKFNIYEAEEEDILYGISDQKDKIVHMKNYMKEIENNLDGKTIDDIADYKRERYLKYMQIIMEDRKTNKLSKV